MDAVKQIYLLLICQGFYQGSVCQDWTFPSRITALIGSCVEIPCTYHPPWFSSTVWSVDSYRYGRYLEILNTKNSSFINEEYKNRTSLVPGKNSCTLRIDPVTERDEGRYYPVNVEDDYIYSHRRRFRAVFLQVTDTMEVQLYVPELMTEGEATTVRCTTDHTCRSSPPSLQWNKPGQVKHQSVDINRGLWREESELVYIPSYVDDGSPVHCTAIYPNGQKTETSRTLNITYAPKNLTAIITWNHDLMKGIDVRLQCNSFSNPDVYEYEWYKGKTKLPDRGREITVRNVTRDMEPYSCAARNRVGRGESSPTEIPVPYAAIGVHIIVKNEHEITELICDFLRSRPDVTHYTWKKDGSTLQNETGKTLTVHNNDGSYGQYSCIAHNSAGDSSSEEINIKAEESKHIILLTTIGAICLLLLLALPVYACWRKRQKKITSTEDEATYTDLRRSDIASIYDQLQPGIPADTTAVGSSVAASNVYENIHKQSTFSK